MADLHTRFLDALARTGINPTDSRPVVVGLSGGADSVALLALLAQAGVKVVAAHVNFGMRGAESERDQAVAVSIAQRLGAEVRVRRFKVDPSGSAVEETCRRLRYEWFDTLAREVDAQAIAVGHHRRDQAETMLMNLLDRRSGISGLRGMKPRNGLIARPLLDFDPDRLRQWLAEQGLEWVDDSSNSSLHYRRNVMRHCVLPALEEAMTGGRHAVDSLAASASHLYADECLLDALAAAVLKRHTGSDGISVTGILAELGDQAALLLARCGVLGRKEAETAVIAARDGRNGLRFGPYTLHDGVLTTPSDQIAPPPHTSEVVSEFTPGEGVCAAWFDLDAWTSTRKEASWRHPRPGERFKTFGLRGRGSRLISDLLKEAGIAANRRSSFMMLCLGDEPVWLPGVANSAHCPITPTTRKILKFKLLK